MPSRRRSANKNLGNNLAEVQRRLRYLERRPVRSKLGSKVVTGAAIAPNSVTPDQVTFGTTIASTDPNITASIQNPKDGLVIANPETGQTQVYSEQYTSYISVSDPVAAGDAFDAYNYAGTAQETATTAQRTADGKNTVYRQSSAPTGGTYAVGDVWFNTSADNQINRWSGSAWSPVALGDNALASISANKITAGTIDARVITVSNLDAGNITVGELSASRIGAGNITATISIKGPTITGGTIRTDEEGRRRIAITDTDDIIFYGDTGARSGTVTSIGGTWSGDTENPYVIPGGIMIYGGSAVVSNGSTTYPSIVAAADSVYMYGDSVSRFSAKNNLLGMYGPEAYIYNDITTIYTGYGTTGGRPWHLYLQGRLRLSEGPDGPLLYGSGIPTTPGSYDGQVCFRYV